MCVELAKVAHGFSPLYFSSPFTSMLMLFSLLVAALAIAPLLGQPRSTVARWPQRKVPLAERASHDFTCGGLAAAHLPPRRAVGIAVRVEIAVPGNVNVAAHVRH